MYNVKFLVVSSGKSDVTVNENKTPVGNASTVVGSTRIEYCLGNSTNIDASSIGEIIPIYTEQSVIKYYYRNKDGKLVEILNTLMLTYQAGLAKNLLLITLININS